MSGIDWNTELKKIEREFDGLPPAPTPGARRAQLEAERRSKERAEERERMIGAALRLGLVIALAVSVNFWPYPRACGFSLFVFLAAQAAVVLGGLWSAVYTWRGRLPRAHALAMLVMLAGLVLLAAQVLPRTGYARTPTGQPLAWMCG